MQIPRGYFNEKFYPLLFQRPRYLLLYGSRGSSKSEFVAQYVILRSMCKEYFKLVYSRKYHEHIRHSQFSLIKKWIRRFGLQDCFRIYENSMVIENILTGNTMIPKGMDDPEKIKSLDEPSHIWMEELTEFDQVDFETINNTIRTSKTKTQAIMTFNPIDENNWVRSYFFDEYDNTQPHPRFGDKILLHHSTFRDNRFIDGDEYHENLRMTAAGDDNHLNVNAYGLWGVPRKDNKFCWAFDRKKHVKPLDYEPENCPWISFDFNVDPITCIIARVVPQYLTVQVFECFKLQNSDIYALCDKVLTAYPNERWRVTGDSSGNNRSVLGQDQYTCYSIIQSKLRVSDHDLYVPRQNPLIEENQMLVNTVLRNWTVEIDPDKCKPLIYDMEYVEIDREGKIVKDRKTQSRKSDFLDAWRYLCNVAIGPDQAMQTFNEDE